MSSISKFQFEQMQARLNRPDPAPDAPDHLRPESALHQQVKELCQGQWPRWKFVHARMDRATPRDQTGVCDFVLCLPDRVTVYLELKRPGEKNSLAQRDWMAEMARLGHEVHVAHDLAEVRAAIQKERVGQAHVQAPTKKR